MLIFLYSIWWPILELRSSHAPYHFTHHRVDLCFGHDFLPLSVKRIKSIHIYLSSSSVCRAFCTPGIPIMIDRPVFILYKFRIPPHDLLCELWLKCFHDKF